MINTEKLKQVIEAYKADFSDYFEKERYKWEAVKCFQDNWNINASDFVAMLKKSMSKTYNLLASGYAYPRRMIKELAEADTQAVKSMFINLFDESKSLVQRIEAFINSAEAVRKKYDKGTWKNHYQNTNAVSVYLWLMYPDKYYIYKYDEFKNVAKLVEDNYHPQANGSVDNVIGGFKMYDDMRSILKEDKEIKSMLLSKLNGNCYPDPELVTLTLDVGFYISRYYHEKTNMDKPTYLNEIITILKKLGGKASLSEIYNAIQDRDLLPSIRTNPTWKNTVRSEIQRHCKETKSYIEGNEELFYSVNGLNNGIWGLIGFEPDKAVEEVEQITPQAQNDSYTKSDFLKDVFLTEKQYDTLAALLQHKKNVILQGAPGVGKTFTAKRLTYSLMGEKNDSRIEFIQFHQSYSYEDFIMGYRPNEDGSFKLKKGVFYRFCEKARNDTDRDYFFIIDEINRGNLSKIFGEMLMLIESDKRGDKLKLTYQKEDDEPFSVPDNVYIIGMMNTADRSLAMIDYALRRRFSFFEMEPGFDSDGFKEYGDSLKNDTFDTLIGQIKLLNKDIEKDSSLGKGFCVGHSYFCNLTADTCTDERLHAVVEYDIIPMLSEYWFDDKDKVEKWSANLRGIFNDD